nr:helicase-related protein [Bacillus ectoiniformans]
MTDRQKLEALSQTVDEMNPFLAIIFCRTKRRVSKLYSELKYKGYNVDELHGDLSQAKREGVMKRFRDAKIQLLVATDVAARGLDVEGVTHVFNYDIPQDVESYIHRIGRTGRAGEDGVAITFVAPKDKQDIQMIEAGIDMKIERKAVEIDPAKVADRPANPDRKKKVDPKQKREENIERNKRGQRGTGAKRGSSNRRGRTSK